MGGGIHSQTGYTYQNLVGVYRIFEFITNDSIQYIEFESEGEELEDINLFYSNHTIYEQVKYKRHNDWTPNELKQVMRKFLRFFDNSIDCSLRFTTNTKGNRELTQIDALRKRLQNDEKCTLTTEDIRLLRRCFPDGVSVEEMIWVYKHLSFDWNRFNPDPNNPFGEILHECCNTLMSICGLDYEYAQSAILKLIQMVLEFSTRQNINRKFTRDSLRKILPNCGKIGLSLLKSEIPDEIIAIIERSNPLHVQGPTPINLGSEIVNVSAILTFNNKQKVYIWIIATGALEVEIQRVDRIVNRTVNKQHIIIALDDAIDPRVLSDESRRVFVKRTELDRLFELLEGIKTDN